MRVLFDRWRDTVRARSLGVRAALLGALVALPLLIFGAVAFYDYLDEVRGAQRSALRSAYALAEHADSVFSSIDIALRHVDRALGARSLADVRADGDLHLVLQDLARRMPQVESLFLVDESGTVAASSRAFPMPPYDVQHREYFLAAKAGEEGLFVSVPFRGEFARSVAFTASRPVLRNGAFRGLIAATVFPEYFHALYRSTFMMEEAGEPTALLVRRDGTVIFRSPEPRASDTLLVSADLLTQASTLNTGLLLGPGTIDARSDITAFRALPNAPLTFVYGVRQADLTADWYRRLAGYGLVMACVSGALATGGALLLFPGASAREQSLAAQASPEGDGGQMRRLRGAEALLDAVRASLGLARRISDDPSAGGGQDPRDLLDGASFGTTAAQRLVAGRGGRLDARIVNVRVSLREVRRLLMGSIWPPLDVSRLDQGADPFDVFVEPGAFDLALVDLTLGLWERAPLGIRLVVEAERRTVRPEDTSAPVIAGDYVTITVVLAGDQDGEGAPHAPVQARLMRVEAFAQANDGALELVEHGPRISRGTLWLPAALVSEESRRV